MELRHLRYFVAVAEELHFGRAAARVHIAQPPLSQQIKALEGELGVQLFLRTRRRVELTDAGRSFLVEARATLAQAQRAEQAARDAGRGIQGRLAVGFVTSACHTVLPVVVRKFRTEYPQVEITLREMTPAEQLAGIERREIDVGFLRPPMVHPGIGVEVIMSEPLVAALPQAHPLARRATVSLKEMCREPFVLFPRRHGPGLYDVVMAACQETGLRPVLAHEPDEMQSLLAHIAGGLGVSLVPASLMGFFPADIEYRRLRGSRICVELALVWSLARESAIAENFRAIAKVAGKVCLGRMNRSLQRDRKPQAPRQSIVA